MSFAKELQIRKDEIESYLREISFSGIPEPLKSSVEYSLLDGGKRIRPILFLECFRIFGGELNESVKKFACALECVHIYSLIHDDLPCMDDDDFRRGRPTNHKIFGENIAVLAGDALLNLSYELIFEAIELSNCNIKFIEAGKTVAEHVGGKGLIAGQALDITAEKDVMTSDKINYIYRHKTGDLIKVAMISGAMIAGASDDQIDKIKKYADGFGLAFQIKDDLLDLENGERGAENDYVAVYGEKTAKASLSENIDKAVCALSGLERNAEFLIEFALKSVIRKQ